MAFKAVSLIKIIWEGIQLDKQADEQALGDSDIQRTSRKGTSKGGGKWERVEFFKPKVKYVSRRGSQLF